MIVIQGTPYRISIDERNYTLERRSVKGESAKNPGEEYFITVGHHSSLLHALRSLRTAMQRDKLCAGMFSLIEAINAINRSDREFYKAVRAMGLTNERGK